MASQIIGRTTCPECAFAGAHVKRSEKTLYRYCPECGSQSMARSKRQEADLLAKTRLLDALDSPGSASASGSVGSASAQTLPLPVALAPALPEMPPPVPAKPARRGLFS